MNIRKNAPVVWAGRIVKTVSFHSNEALIIWIDHLGRIQERHVPIASLTSFADAMQPRSLWPDTNTQEEQAPRIRGWRAA
ncbi:hypothetical protein [Nitrobacter hamburgensis]|uniref:hypothetical protein n=1 Tax=Nitrobacter hamburgensis TaxID=912 RepID=UPI0002FEFC76|nr:hypothetical protein [Nitrobacter hamburgensis]